MTDPTKSDTIGVGTPVGIFFCYAHEDGDIVSVFYDAFEQLERAVGGNLQVFRDRSSISPGTFIGERIKEQLKLSNYLVVFYTSTARKNVSWNGVEVGFFQALMDADRKAGIQGQRSIVPVYLDELPPSLSDVKGISLPADPQDLSRSREEYVRILRPGEGQEDDDALSAFMREVARRAEDGLPAVAGGDKGRAEKQRKRRDVAIDEEIVPTILSAMYDCLGARIAKKSIEQKLVQFEIDASSFRGRSAGIPPEAELKEHGGVLELFNLPTRDTPFTWKDFVAELTAGAPDQAPAIIRAIERVFDTAVSKVTPVDNDQLIKSLKDGTLFRVLVTRHFNFYNGNKIVHMYFVEKLQRKEYGAEDTTVTLAYLNVAARYRSIFLEPRSELSIKAFKNEGDHSRLQKMVRLTEKEIILIEDEAEQLKLDSIAAKIVLWGEDADLQESRVAKQEWIRVRTALFACADEILSATPDTPEFNVALASWMSSLETFTAAAKVMNIAIGSLALARLQEFFRN